MWYGSYMKNSEIGSNQARDNFAEVLADVEHNNISYFVKRYKKPVAVIVPVWWYEQAKGLLGNGEQS
jgi:antitoxin (DNA-binding transcriptional repressor) of toxin-antitoxin stability system